jgi:hypothetical protein
LPTRGRPLRGCVPLPCALQGEGGRGQQSRQPLIHIPDRVAEIQATRTSGASHTALEASRGEGVVRTSLFKTRMHAVECDWQARPLGYRSAHTSQGNPPPPQATPRTRALSYPTTVQERTRQRTRHTFHPDARECERTHTCTRTHTLTHRVNANTGGGKPWVALHQLGSPPAAKRAARTGAEPSTAHSHVGLAPLALPAFGFKPAANRPCNTRYQQQARNGYRRGKVSDAAARMRA